jgi:hypothetical protein
MKKKRITIKIQITCYSKFKLLKITVIGHRKIFLKM